MKAWTVLVAEDNENDVLILQHAFSRIKSDVSLIFVKDGEEAIHYLSGRDGFKDRDQYPFPDALLLDLKMPKIDGFSVLQWLRDHPPMHRLRVLVFSSSGYHSDIDRAYDLGASSFIQKPTALDDMAAIVNYIGQWLQRNKFSLISQLDYPAG